MFELTYFAIAITAFLIASYQDIKTHEISPKITIGLLAIGIISHAVESYLIQSIQPIFQSVSLAILCFAFAYLLYKIGVWAGGDVKLFTALGAILPTFGNFNFFPFYSLFAALVAILPFTIIYVAYHLLFVKGIYKKSKKIILLGLRRSLKSPFAVIAGYNIALLAGYSYLSFIIIPFLFWAKKPGLIASVILTAVAFYYDFAYYLNQFAGVFFISLLIFISISFFSIARKHVLRGKKSVAKLEEGDILAKNLIKEKTKHVFKEFSMFSIPKNIVISSSASGLEKKDIAKLKKLKIKRVEVKKSIPFVPVFTLGLLLLLAVQMLLY